MKELWQSVQRAAMEEDPMLKSHEKFHSRNGKRQILVVDDEFINREMMGAVLENDYEVIFAENGQQAMEFIRENADTLSLVLLDLMMPVMSGKEVLRQIKSDPAIRQIPVIVLTADQNAEVETLNLGAVDFIPKPYPEGGVILARILRTIELSEDRQIIQSTERDPLTGLYNREYFYRYAEQFDHHHRGLEMDAIVVDINHFHMINERFGTTYGDEVLRRIGQKVREMVSDTGGIVCRREADTFMVYCPHRTGYKDILDSASVGLAEDDSINSRIRLRMGVYANVDKALEIERRFDRAKMAADTVRNSFTKTIGIYDKTLHERELYAEQLIDDFPRAIEEHQFAVFYQPKFDVRPEIPVLASAEALVRWLHPDLGMISPGTFIPLFEENGLIQRLDEYVWRTTAAQIADWKRRFDFSVPVSVNVSRIDMYDPRLIETFQRILSEHGLAPDDFYLEITESAYTQNSEQIIATVNQLRDLGFCIEMDDFGTGYSSLNMISSLPIDALKLDMQFIRTAFNERRDTRMIEVIIDIADYLAVPVIAEGVETKEQLDTLKSMGCDLVQGFYFSRPVPAEEYESFVIERKEQQAYLNAQAAEVDSDLNRSIRNDISFGKIAYALSSGYESIYYVDIDNDHYVEFSSEGKYSDLQIERSGADFWLDTERNIPRVVHRDDRARMSLCMQKDALLSQLINERPFSLTYRLVINETPTYYTLKAVRASTHDSHHIVIGVSNVDEQVRQADITYEGNDIDINGLAKALTSDMESIYYIDIRSNAYQVFVANGSYESLKLEIAGDDFFAQCQHDIRKVVFEDDRERVMLALERGNLLSTLRQHQTLTMDYRLIIDGRPTFYRLKAMPANKPDADHIIIGVSNIDDQVSDNQRLEAARRSEATYAHIAEALAQDYFSIYYVDLDNDHFIEYSAHDEYSSLDIEKSGSDFFGTSRTNIRRVAHPDDLSPFLEAFTKENILQELECNGSFTITYRLLFDGTPTYVHMKATRMTDPGDHHLVIGVSNIDAQMRREQEHAAALRAAKEAAYRDQLTGVKSKHAYSEDEASLDKRVAAGEAEAFALAICDVNDLKTVNDTLGHAAGDELIRTACRKVCTIFAHSPVYRYGGDEFVAILRGSDYERRRELIGKMASYNRTHVGDGSNVIVACGMAVYDSGADTCVADVFRRADVAMYLDKKELKALAHQTGHHD